MNNDKDIKEFLEKNEDIIVPESITNGIDSTLSEIKKKKYKKRKGGKVLIAASVATLLIGGSVYGSDTVSATINDVVSKIDVFFGGTLREEGVDNYKTTIGTTVEDKGLKVTLGDFFMVDDKVYMNVSLDSENIEGLADGIDANIFINGKKVELLGLQRLADKSNFTENKNDKKMGFLLSANIKDVKLEEVENVKVSFYDAHIIPKKYADRPRGEALSGGELEEVVTNKPMSGKWEFEFNYDAKKMAESTSERKINKSINIENLKVDLETVKITPISTTVKYKVTGKLGEKAAVGFGIIDKKGNIESGPVYGEANTQWKSEVMLSTNGLDKLVLVPYISEFGKRVDYFEDKAITIDLK